MPWVKLTPAPADVSTFNAKLMEVRGLFPSEYSRIHREIPDLPASVRRDSIVGAHAPAPDVMEHVFKGLAAAYAPTLPLSRRQHEMIAVTVSTLNDCFY